MVDPLQPHRQGGGAEFHFGRDVLDRIDALIGPLQKTPLQGLEPCQAAGEGHEPAVVVPEVLLELTGQRLEQSSGR